MNCLCGCGSPVEGLTRGKPRRYVSGHNLRGLERTADYRAAIGSGQRRAWQTKRQRLPVGTTRISASGYVLVKVHPGAGHWKPQHVLFIEQAIGRTLKPGEHVHHINAVKTDNRLANLHLFAGRHEHSTAHGSLNGLIDQLLDRGVIGFDRDSGRYFLSAEDRA